MAYTKSETGFTTYEKGDQIIYIPQHANCNFDHPDCEFGFVWVEKEIQHDDDVIFCRYWRKGKPGELRTKVNSEATSWQNLYLFKSVHDNIVLQAIQEIERSMNATEKK